MSDAFGEQTGIASVARRRATEVRGDSPRSQHERVVEHLSPARRSAQRTFQPSFTRGEVPPQELIEVVTLRRSTGDHQQPHTGCLAKEADHPRKVGDQHPLEERAIGNRSGARRGARRNIKVRRVDAVGRTDQRQGVLPPREPGMWRPIEVSPQAIRKSRSVECSWPTAPFELGGGRIEADRHDAS